MDCTVLVFMHPQMNLAVCNRLGDRNVVALVATKATLSQISMLGVAPARNERPCDKGPSRGRRATVRRLGTSCTLSRVDYPPFAVQRNRKQEGECK